MKTIFNLKMKLIKFSVLLFLLPCFGSFAPNTFQGLGQSVNAQTSEILLNSQWFLRESSVNGNTINTLVFYAFLIPDDFGDYSFIFKYGTLNCDESFKINFTDVTADSFNLSSVNEYVSCNFTDPEEIEAVELYHSFYFDLPFDLNSTPKNPFTYEWVDASPFADMLRITNNQGDWLLYFRYELSTTSFHQNSFIIYPNPVKENLTINNISNQSVTATIYDVNGKHIQRQDIKNNISTINVKTLKSGLYFVVFENEVGERVSKKFVKH